MLPQGRGSFVQQEIHLHERSQIPHAISFWNEFYVDYVPSTDHISSVKVGGGASTDTVKLLSTDSTIDMKIYFDNTFAEGYFMGGRVAMTVKTGSTVEAGMSVTSNAAVTLNSATAWSVGSIWVAPEEVRATPRLDAQQTLV